jgi:hypothetical protein
LTFFCPRSPRVRQKAHLYGYETISSSP